MNGAHHTPLAVARSLWSFIRSLACDNAYELYLDHHRAKHPDERSLSRREFYLREQQRKWGGITRCC
jgi:uncharacterized short protein YbdD (DUF466 family)